jgi:hypothetical protein
LTRVAAEKRKEFSNTMLSLHMAERKELDEQSTKPDMELGGEVQGFLYRLQSLREDVLHRDDRLRTASARAPAALLHRRIGSNDTDVAIATDADAPPRVARDAARLSEYRRGHSSDTDRAIVGSMAASVTDDAYPSVTGFTAASDDALEEAIRASLQEFNAVTSPAASILDQVQRQEEDEMNAPQEWSCVACTFMNTSGRRCAMCRTRRAG